MALPDRSQHGDRFPEEPRQEVHGRAEIDAVVGFEDKPDPAVVRAALARFVALPVTQRSAVILKDVLGHSLQETAETMGTTVMAVKAALVRGRPKLLEEERERTASKATARADLDRYTALFNARDWDGVRALVGDDCRLDLVSKAHRRGKQVGMYFGRYEKEDVALRVVRLEGPACARGVRRGRRGAGLLHRDRVGRRAGARSGISGTSRTSRPTRVRGPGLTAAARARLTVMTVSIRLDGTLRRLS